MDLLQFQKIIIGQVLQLQQALQMKNRWILRHHLMLPVRPPTLGKIGMRVEAIALATNVALAKSIHATELTNRHVMNTPFVKNFLRIQFLLQTRLIRSPKHRRRALQLVAMELP